MLSFHLRQGFPSGHFPLVFPPKSYMHSSWSHSCYMPSPSHPPWFHHSNYTWRRIQVMKLLIMQFSPTSYHYTIINGYVLYQCILIHPSIYPTSCFHLEHRASVKHLVSLQFLNLRQSVGLLGRGISQTQGRYLHRTTQTQNKRRHPYLEWDSIPRSKCSSGRRHFIPQTARPL
jgi:hypothetical protein